MSSGRYLVGLGHVQHGAPAVLRQVGRQRGGQRAARAAAAQPQHAHAAPARAALQPPAAAPRRRAQGRGRRAACRTTRSLVRGRRRVRLCPSCHTRTGNFERDSFELPQPHQVGSPRSHAPVLAPLLVQRVLYTCTKNDIASSLLVSFVRTTIAHGHVHVEWSWAIVNVSYESPSPDRILT